MYLTLEYRSTQVESTFSVPDTGVVSQVPGEDAGQLEDGVGLVRQQLVVLPPGAGGWSTVKFSTVQEEEGLFAA